MPRFSIFLTWHILGTSFMHSFVLIKNKKLQIINCILYCELHIFFLLICFYLKTYKLDDNLYHSTLGTARICIGIFFLLKYFNKVFF